MALNFTVSYTFSPGTTISSSQVNTNTTDVANVFTGLEAETKTLAKLKVDIDPTLALEVATKQYVDHYSTYRRPVLQYSSGTVVNLETGINGTSGQAAILFPDGSIRTDSTATRINLDVSRAAAFSGSAQSGMDTGTVAANTRYSVYAVKVTDSSTNFVTSASLSLPSQANFSSLNSVFGANSWVYLGMVAYGDESGTTTAILKFVQIGNMTLMQNTCVGNARNMTGIRLATTAGAGTLTYTYVSGRNAGQVPNQFGNVCYGFAMAKDTTGGATIRDSSSTRTYAQQESTNMPLSGRQWMPAAEGLNISPLTAPSLAMDIYLSGWVDGVLGVGSNPIL